MKSTLINGLLNISSKIDLYRAMRFVAPNLLTVLNYHRIDDPYAPEFHTLRINVSATQEDFAQQMDFVGKNYNVVNCKRLVSFINGETELPPNAALITFDDGYLDNYTNAYPVLVERGLPAIIFLTSGFIGTNKPFYWDYISYCFYKTAKNGANLPLIGTQNWDDVASRERVLLQWIEALKRIPEVQKSEYVSQIAELLEVNVPESAFEKLILNWDQVRVMSRSGLIEFGVHSVNHPILTRVPINEASREICESKRKIEEETGHTVNAIAYPNGGVADFSQPVIQASKEAGLDVAFSHIPGPTRYSTVKKEPFSIRRIFLAHYDTFPRFVAKISGLSRFQ